MIKKINCPCCGGILRHKDKDNTHIWSCEDCPVVMFEYYSSKDIKNVSKYLSGK